jgi:hypothetical protein
MRIENQMSRKERQNLGIYPSIGTPISGSPNAVVLLGLMRNPKLIQLVNVVLIMIGEFEYLILSAAAPPGKFAG